MEEQELVFWNNVTLKLLYDWWQIFTQSELVLVE